MKFNPLIHHRKSIRLKGYDYSSSGLYFITFIVNQRECSFGEIVNDIMILNESGLIVTKYLNEIEKKYVQIELNKYVIMPNHIHLIIEIHTEVTNISEANMLLESETIEISERDKRRKMLLSKFVGWLKMNTAKEINILNQNSGGNFWQRDYYEHIIRDIESYKRIANYISNNPTNWNLDEFYK
ncbi:MAG TPA: transposase [Saprospiraceae bacterium]|nr:transposase [Saprospiraceae bacterium]